MNVKKSIGFGAIISLVMACTTNPMTGRKSLQLVGNAKIATMATQQYNQTLAKAKVIKGTKSANQVKSVGIHIKNAAENYYKSIGREKDLANYNWEFNLLEQNQLNAWCMPGGKVAVYTGILPVTQSDAGLAVVMGHEVAHALAGHGNERISQSMMAQYGGVLLGSAISNAQWAKTFSTLYPYGAKVGLLAYGRKQELEADHMGLQLMAMAGYDPREAVPFWGRMAKASSGQRQPEFLSTHPGPENRIAKLNEQMPTALDYYKKAGGKL